MNRTQTLADYLSSARAAGLSHQDMAVELTNAGWHLVDVLQAIGQLPTAPAVTGVDAIAVSGVVKSFGTVKAVAGVDIRVPEGTIFALLGHNGAGKTTLVRMMSTLLKPDAGTIMISGHDAVRQAQQTRTAIGLTGQYAAVDEYLTGRENLELIGALYHLTSDQIKARSTELLQQFDLTDAANRQAKTYSGGMRRRLDLAASLMNRPKVLFLDEPTTGLDPASRIGMWDVITKLKEAGTTIFLTTQYLEEADKLADRIAVIDHGRIIAEGTADELKRMVGGDVVEVHVEQPSDLVRASVALARTGTAAHTSETDPGVLVVPAPKGASDLLAAVRELDRDGIVVADIALRRPTLDDVFLSLTNKR